MDQKAAVTKSVEGVGESRSQEMAEEEVGVEEEEEEEEEVEVVEEVEGSPTIMMMVATMEGGMMGALEEVTLEGEVATLEGEEEAGEGVVAEIVEEEVGEEEEVVGETLEVVEEEVTVVEVVGIRSDGCY